MDSISLDDDKPTGTETILHIDDGKLTIERRADTQPILDQVKAIKSVTDGRSASGDLCHIARIPSVVVEKYCNLQGISFHEFVTDDTHITRLLNDSDYAYLRIWEGHA